MTVHVGKDGGVNKTDEKMMLRMVAKSKRRPDIKKDSMWKSKRRGGYRVIPRANVSCPPPSWTAKSTSHAHYAQ